MENNSTLTDYQIKLKDPRWQKKRLKILERDHWYCQSCMSCEKTLAVHHKLYLPDLYPWEYPDHLLITLCEDCHKYELENRATIEANLLNTLKSKFLAPCIQRLDEGFQNLKMIKRDSLIAESLWYAMSRENITWLLLKKMVKGELKEVLEEETKDKNGPKITRG